jgi:hypothetical protein
VQYIGNGIGFTRSKKKRRAPEVHPRPATPAGLMNRPEIPKLKSKRSSFLHRSQSSPELLTLARFSASHTSAGLGPDLNCSQMTLSGTTAVESPFSGQESFFATENDGFFTEVLNADVEATPTLRLVSAPLPL